MMNLDIFDGLRSYKLEDFLVTAYMSQQSMAPLLSEVFGEYMLEEVFKRCTCGVKRNVRYSMIIKSNKLGILVKSCLG